MMNGLYVVQGSGQWYAVYTPQGIQIATIFLGNDGQLMADAVTMKSITALLAKRWGITSGSN